MSDEQPPDAIPLLTQHKTPAPAELRPLGGRFWQGSTAKSEQRAGGARTWPVVRPAHAHEAGAATRGDGGEHRRQVAVLNGAVLRVHLRAVEENAG